MISITPRWRASISGAVLGGLIWSGLDALGFWAVLKLSSHVSSLLIAIVICAAAAMTKLRSGLSIVSGLIVLTLLVVSFTPLSEALVRPLVRADAIPAGKLDAIVVLSGGMTSDALMTSESLDRLIKGVEIIREGKGSALVISRERSKQRGRSASDSADQATVLALGAVPAPVLFIDSATSTRDEAMRVNRLPNRVAWRRIAVVTSPLHSSRACATFERAGFHVTCIPAASRDRAIRILDTGSDRLAAFRGWFYECAGWIKYRISGWV